MKVNYRLQYNDIVTNPRWRTAAIMKIVMSVRYVGVEAPLSNSDHCQVNSSIA